MLDWNITFNTNQQEIFLIVMLQKRPSCAKIRFEVCNEMRHKYVIQSSIYISFRLYICYIILSLICFLKVTIHKCSNTQT